MTDKHIPSPEELRKILRYEPETGKLFWLYRPDMPTWWNSRYCGREAFNTENGKGYLHGRINGKNYKTHRIIWAIVKMEWPIIDVDHKNCIKSDNRWSNLRLATDAQNSQNRGKNKNNKSGFKGVSWHSSTNKWRVDIEYNGISKFIGRYGKLDDAVLAYKNAAYKLHGEFARSEFNQII